MVGGGKCVRLVVEWGGGGALDLWFRRRGEGAAGRCTCQTCGWVKGTAAGRFGYRREGRGQELGSMLEWCSKEGRG